MLLRRRVILSCVLLWIAGVTGYLLLPALGLGSLRAIAGRDRRGEEDVDSVPSARAEPEEPQRAADEDRDLEPHS